MPKDPDTPERYAVDAMQRAIGLLEAFRSDQNGVQNVIKRLEHAISKFDSRCDHVWEAAIDPSGGVVGACKKCHAVRRVN